MSLISIPYMVLVLVVVCLYYFVPMAYRWCLLAIANVIFYVSSSRGLSLFLLCSIISIYVGGILLQQRNDKQKKKLKELDKEDKKAFKQLIKKQKKAILVSIVAINIGILLYLKYFNFFAMNLNAIFEFVHLDSKIGIREVILPLGISYYTLMAISYVVDVYRGKYKASYNFFKVALYLSFFPQMVEGPISRFDETADQLYKGNRFSLRNLKCGLYLILWGLFKKMVIADRAALFVNSVFGESYAGATIFLAVVLYTIQIYAEFSGAMDIVRGSGYLFGVYLPQNFNQPFFSKSIAEFWRRWHITLGTWLKDYVFYSVSLSKVNMNLNKSVKKHFSNHFGKFILSAFPLFFVWFFNGFWHGASWKYILYGLYYYIIMMLGLLLQPFFMKMKDKLHIDDQHVFYQVFAIVRTWIIVLGGMLLFRAKSISAAITMFFSIFSKEGLQLSLGGMTKYDYLILIIGILGMFILSILREKQVDVFHLLDEKSVVLRYTIVFVLLFMILIFGIYGEGYDASDFIYGAF